MTSPGVRTDSCEPEKGCVVLTALALIRCCPDPCCLIAIAGSLSIQGKVCPIRPLSAIQCSWCDPSAAAR